MMYIYIYISLISSGIASARSRDCPHVRKDLRLAELGEACDFSAFFVGPLHAFVKPAPIRAIQDFCSLAYGLV